MTRAAIIMLLYCYANRIFLRSVFQLILDRIYKGINDKLNHGSAVKKSLFNFAYNYKKKWVRKGFSTPLIDRYEFHSMI